MSVHSVLVNWQKYKRSFSCAVNKQKKDNDLINLWQLKPLKRNLQDVPMSFYQKKYRKIMQSLAREFFLARQVTQVLHVFIPTWNLMQSSLSMHDTEKVKSGLPCWHYWHLLVRPLTEPMVDHAAWEVRQGELCIKVPDFLWRRIERVMWRPHFLCWHLKHHIKCMNVATAW